MTQIQMMNTEVRHNICRKIYKLPPKNLVFYHFIEFLLGEEFPGTEMPRFAHVTLADGLLYVGVGNDICATRIILTMDELLTIIKFGNNYYEFNTEEYEYLTEQTKLRVRHNHIFTLPAVLDLTKSPEKT